jgi:DNA topoisomerase-2
MGHLLTGSNFDDAASAAATGGRHGYGAKLTNIFSNKFVVSTSSKALKKTYTQEWESNMKTRHDPLITTDAGIAEDATEVVFHPDLARMLIDCLLVLFLRP